MPPEETLQQKDQQHVVVDSTSGMVSMQTYVDVRFIAAEKELAAIMQMIEAMQQRINNVEVNHISRSEHDRLDARIQALEKEGANTAGRFWAFGIGISILSIVVSLLIHFL